MPLSPERPAILGDRSVDVWQVHLAAPDQMVSAFERLLLPEEAARATRFRFEHLRRSWVLARGALRLLLGAYVGIPAPEVRLSTGQRGKPKLDIPGNLKFNLSHSGAVAIFGFTAECEIGVDVEQVHPLEDMSGIAKRFFCPEEASELISLAASEREAAFFQCWTRKEAYLKAIGEGFHEPLDGFRVSLRPGEPASIIHINGSIVAAAGWTLHDIASIPGYAAALAYQDVPRPVRLLPPLSPAELLEGALRS